MAQPKIPSVSFELHPGAIIIVMIIGFLGVILYSLLCGASNFHRRGVIGQINVFLRNDLMFMIRRMCVYCVGTQQRKTRLGRCFDYCLNKPNPIFQVVYLFCIIGGYIYFLNTAWVFIQPPYISSLHRIIGHIAVIITLFSFLVASLTPPFPPPNSSAPNSYPPSPISSSSASATPIPPRSKFCKICNVIIPRYDHHCVWVNNCVGQYNHIHFILFILCTSLLCLYVSMGLSLVIYRILVIDVRIFEIVLKNRATGEVKYLGIMDYVGIVMWKAGTIVPLVFFTFIMGAVLFAFTLYHAWLTSCNVTSFESYKYSMLKDSIESSNKVWNEIEQEAKEGGKEKEKGGKRDIGRRYGRMIGEGIRKTIWEAIGVDIWHWDESFRRLSTVHSSSLDELRAARAATTSNSNTNSSTKKKEKEITEGEVDERIIQEIKRAKELKSDNIYGKGLFGNWRELIGPGLSNLQYYKVYKLFTQFNNNFYLNPNYKPINKKPKLDPNQNTQDRKTQ